jgi:hypothetical protein
MKIIRCAINYCPYMNKYPVINLKIMEIFYLLFRKGPNILGSFSLISAQGISDGATKYGVNSKKIKYKSLFFTT